MDKISLENFLVKLWKTKMMKMKIKNLNFSYPCDNHTKYHRRHSHTHDTHSHGEL
jgi:hypothetical protein